MDNDTDSCLLLHELQAQSKSKNNILASSDSNKEEFKNFLGRRSYINSETKKRDDSTRTYDGLEEYFAKKGYKKSSK